VGLREISGKTGSIGPLLWIIEQKLSQLNPFANTLDLCSGTTGSQLAGNLVKIKHMGAKKYGPANHTGL
jgi:hypothetical protein